MKTLLFLLCTLLTTLHAETDALAKDAVTQRIASGIAALNERYWSPTLCIWFDRPGDDVRAHYEGRLNPPWWCSANAVEALLDAMKVTGSREYQAAAESLYALHRDHKNKAPRIIAELQRRKQWSDADAERAKRPAKPVIVDGTEYYTEFRNEYLDDSGWWALAWLKMYDRTHEAKYLATAKAIHAHMAKNWRPEKGGGVMWCEDADKQVPNAITNQLFGILSARLFQRTKEPAYLDWAERTLAWIRAKSLYDGNAIVDGPGHRGDYWNTNQGTYIGLLVALHQATARAEFLAEAATFADGLLARAGITKPGGVLVEKLGTQGDASLFKGILVRYLAQLRDVLNAAHSHPETARLLDQTIRTSVASMLQHSLTADGTYSAAWHEGADEQSHGFNAQVSAIAALIGVLPDAQP